MSKKKTLSTPHTRRTFIGGATAGALVGGTTGCATPASRAKTAPSAPPQRPEGPFNILFILTDQERYFDPKTLPKDYALPGRERLQREGTSFTNHQIGTAVCSSSRSVIYTGQHVQKTKVFDNLGFPWSNELSLDTPTIGAYLKQEGYYPAYLGKCHMLDALEEIEIANVPDVNLQELNETMEHYGFHDYVGVGDVIGMTMGGYKSDEFTTATAIRWLRSQPARLAEQPWFLAVNLVNPHDVMFFNTDPEDGEHVQESTAAMPLNREPVHELYQREWDMPLPRSRQEPWNQPGRPRAHQDFQKARGALVGQIPDDDARWKRLQDYYLNCIADCDKHIERLLQELDDLGLADNTIVVVTSDHGELAGAHQMHGKGATAYREQVQVPLWIRHPGYPESAGAECKAVTSHVDLVPTMLGFAGISPERKQELAPELKGVDVGGLLESPEKASLDSVRDGALYSFNMWLFQDPDFLSRTIEGMKSGQDMSKLKSSLDLSRRGAIRSMTDGRYRFSRYFSPTQHNSPQTLKELFENNDVELYDLQSDPDELTNLALDRSKNAHLLEAMNEKLEALIAREVGVDRGDFLPKNDHGWALEHLDP